MKITHAAAFSTISFLIAALFSFFVQRPGLWISGALLPRQTWIVENQLLWSIGWWLWLLAIFAWMVLLLTLMWSYSPAHRVATMLQSGVMVIAAVLSIAAVIVMMAMMSTAASQDSAELMMPLVDSLALGLMGAGLFMGGAVTAWLVVDLGRLDALPWSWLWPGVVAGLCAIPSPFLLPNALLLVAGLLFWLVWCGFLASRRKFPKAYAEWL